MPQLIVIFLTILSLFPSLQSRAFCSPNATPEKPGLYADMARGADGQYFITRITTEKSRIDFMTLKPLGFDQVKWDCSRMLFGRFTFSDHRDCIPSGSEFRTSAIRPMATLLLGATTLGASMIFGLIIEESIFDQASYDRAVTEAIRNSGLEGKREGLIKRFLALNDRFNDRNKELSEMFWKYRDEYYNNDLPASVEKRIVDESGLYTNDLYADVIIRVNRNALSELRPHSAASLSIAGTPAEFEERLSAIEGSLHDEKTVLETALKNATRDYPVFCGPEHLEPYHLKYDCPSRVNSAEDELPVARAIIISKDIRGALPESFEAEDTSMKVTFKKGKLFIENRTLEKLNITGASLRYRGFSANSFRPVVVPPGSKIDATVLYKLLTPEIEKAASFANMTLTEAEKTPVGVALSVTYELESGKKTLTGERVFKLSDLISKENLLNDRPTALR
jgi:hypothetical protein